MSSFEEISAIDPVAADLLRTVGVGVPAQLAVQHAESLTAELNKANLMLEISENSPKLAEVSLWIEAAEVFVGESEDRPTVFKSAPSAKKEAINRTEERGEVVRENEDFDASKFRQVANNLGTSLEEEQAKARKKNEDRVDLIRMPLKSTNQGKNPASRRYIRGVLHSHPWSLRIGAFVTLMTILLFPTTLIIAFLLLISKKHPELEEILPEWLVFVPIAFPVFGLLYLIFGLSSRCQICTQKIFAKKSASRHVKAHRIYALGQILPACLHILLFSWFRCSSCGTPMRLKK